ncbi:MAG: septum formation protein Maf [Planctomycetes bacterium SCN 63-9]|nr:MAG: septum formation protein Maf [Planctomycetes bacterium SCN 63-9]
MTLNLVLASTSPYRRILLERLGIPFRCVAPRFDEANFPGEGLDPRSLAEALAVGKALSVEAELPDATIIGSDQLVALEGRVFGKPGSAEKAVEQLEAMSGRSHQLVTAMVVRHQGQTIRHVDLTNLHMRALDLDAIRRYVERDRPYDCAGSYKLEAAGITLFDRIETDDQTAITGLPLIALTSILRGLGYPIP